MLRILDRYLIRELAFGLIASAALLLLVTLGGTLSDVLSKVATGRYPAGVMFPVVGLRILDAMSTLLPLALFLGVLLGLARLYRDSEMHVLASSGMGPRDLLRPALLLGLPMTVLVGIISLWLGPWAAHTSQTIVNRANRSIIAAGLEAGRFTELPGGGGMMFVAGMNVRGTHLRGIFVASDRTNTQGLPEVNLITAANGDMHIDPQSGARYLVLHDGHRYVGVLGQSNWKLMDFRSNDISLAQVDAGAGGSHITVHERSTLALLSQPDPKSRAEMAWRLTAPVSTLVLLLLALPLSRQGPRESFYGRLLIAVLAYLIYANLLSVGRAEILAGHPSGAVLMWGVQIITIGLALGLFRWQYRTRKLKGSST